MESENEAVIKCAYFGCTRSSTKSLGVHDKSDPKAPVHASALCRQSLIKAYPSSSSHSKAKLSYTIEDGTNELEA
jgi:hypothetical protein